MNARRAGILLALPAGLWALAGCHKAPAPVYSAPAAPRAAAPTPTPTPVSDTVAFVREGALWVEHSDGSGQRPLALPDRDQAFWFPAVAPDGGGVAAWLSKGDGTQDLVLVDPKGGVTALTDTGDPAAAEMEDLSLGNAPSFSPDGRQIVYGFNGDLWIMDADGLNPQTLTTDGLSWSPAWSPDGKRVAYLDGQDAHRDLWVMDLDSRDSTQLTAFTDCTLGAPRWSPDGQFLLLTRIHGDDTDVASIESKQDSPATDADLLTHDHLSAGGVYSPLGDGRVLFSSSRVDGGAWNLYVQDSSGNQTKAITQDGGLVPSWSKAALEGLPTPTVTPSPAPSPTRGGLHPVRATALPARAIAAGRALTASSTAGARAAARSAASTVPAKVRAKRRRRAHAHAARTPASAKSVSAPARTSPTAKAAAGTASAALPSIKRLPLLASFDAQDALDAATLAGIKALVHRLAPYAAAGYTLDVVGPLDESDLAGLYVSQDARSQARAQEIGAALAKPAGFPASLVKADPYSPPSGGGEPKTVFVYVRLR